MQTILYSLFWIRLRRLLSGLALFIAMMLLLGWPRVTRADVIIGGCTIVSNPNASHFTECPGANLSSQNLSGLDLSFADLSDTNLSDANLSNLTAATQADLSGSTLLRANLSNANLAEADLSLANLSGATVSGVTWSNTICPDETNSNAHGNTCIGHMFLPSITASATKADNTLYTAGTATNQNVTVHFTCAAAAGRTLSTCTADQTYTTDGSFTKSGKATDNVGFFSETNFGPIQIDKTVPSITASAAKTDNTPYSAASWSNQNVTVHFVCSDSGFGLAGTCPADQMISSEGVTPPVNGAVSDNAGNSANVSFGPIQVDKTKPAITGNRTPAANLNGWNSGDVTVNFTCADSQGGSSLATNTVAGATVSAEGANQAVTNSGACLDNAANAADAVTVTPINIDKSAPETTITGRPDDPSPLVASFTLSGTDTLAWVFGFQCSLDGAPFTACTSPQNYPTLTAGQHTFQVKAIDAADQVDGTPASYSWTASGDLPVAVDQTVTTAEEQVTAITVQASGKNTLTYTLVSGPVHGVISGTLPTLIYTPTFNFNGNDSFTFRVNDGKFNSNLATVTIHVTPVNDPPVVSQAPLSVVEDTPISLTVSVQDVDGDKLTFAVLSQPAHGALLGTLPTLTYKPAADFSGSDSFTFSVNDGVGLQASNAPASLITATVQISVSAVNDVPVAGDLIVTTPPDTATALILRATDVDGDLLTYALVAPPEHGTLSGLPPTLTYTPAANLTGNDKLTFRASDGQATSNLATITIRVTSQPFAFFLPLVKR